MIAQNQPATLAAMEGLFHTRARRAARDPGPARHADISGWIIQSDSERVELSDLSALDRGGERPRRFPRDHWPDNIELLYFSYHIMVGLGTIFIAILPSRRLAVAGTLFASQAMLWITDARAAVSFHREYGGMDHGGSRAPALADLRIDAHGSGISPLGFRRERVVHTDRLHGMYMVLGILFLFLVYREIEHGPERSAPLDAAAAEEAKESYRDIWFLPGRGDAGGVCLLDGFDIGAGISHLWQRRRNRAQPCSARSARFGTATRCGCSPPGDALLRVPRALRIQLQRILFAADDRPVAADPAGFPSNFAATSAGPSGVRSGTDVRFSSAAAGGIFRRGAGKCGARSSVDARAVFSSRFGPISCPAATTGFSIGTRFWSGWPLFCSYPSRRTLGGDEDHRTTATGRAKNRPRGLVGVGPVHQ